MVITFDLHSNLFPTILELIRFNLLVALSVIIIFSLTVLVYGGINITSLTMKQISAALGVSMGYVYMVLPLSGVLMIFYGVNNILNIIKEKNNVETKQIKKFS